MAMTIFIKTLNDIKDINLPFKFLVKLKKKHLINKAIREINRSYFSSNYFTSSHIINFCRLFIGAKMMKIVKDDKIVQNNHISAGGSEIDVFYSDNSAVMRIKTDTQELIFSATDAIKVEHIDNRDPEHSYRAVYNYDTLESRNHKSLHTHEEMIRVYSYESLYIAFNLILQIVFNALYEKEN